MSLILRSGEHEFWDYPRQLSLAGTAPGPAGRLYARASARPGDLDPPDLALGRRDGTDWRDLAEGERTPVSVWQLPDVATAWLGGAFHPPTANPTAWCTIVSGDLDAELAAWSAVNRGGSVR